MNHKTIKTGIGASMTSVRLRNGSAVDAKSANVLAGNEEAQTVVSQKGHYEVVAQGEQIHGVAEEVGHPVIPGNQGHQQELQDVEECPDRQESSDCHLRESLVSGPCSSDSPV